MEGIKLWKLKFYHHQGKGLKINQKLLEKKI
jgi:hypothetical protein